MVEIYGDIPRPPMSPADSVAGQEVQGLGASLEATLAPLVDIDAVSARVDPWQY
jgi:hypothetical protein